MSRIKICVCTSYAASVEPRAPKHAVSLAKMSDEYQVIFLDCMPRGQARIIPKQFYGIANLVYESHYFPWKKSGAVTLLFKKIEHFLSQGQFITFKLLRSNVLSTRVSGLEKILKRIDADVYIAHNIDMLLPAYKVAKGENALFIFDCQEFYSDMCECQSSLEKRTIRTIENRYLPSSDLVLASSDQLATELVSVYGIKKPLVLYNVPPVVRNLPPKKNEFSLYWRNSTIGFGPRGLADALHALKMLPKEITLHIQGRMPSDSGKALHELIRRLGLEDRVIIRSPYPPHMAVYSASQYTIGLCLERKDVRNHELTVSNKIFDYFMAGLAVVASDLPGLRDIITRSDGGLLYKPGNPNDLAEKLMMLYRDPNLLVHLASQSRSFALTQGNQEHEMAKFQSAFSSLVRSQKE